jgi:hypothetical protein
MAVKIPAGQYLEERVWRRRPPSMSDVPPSQSVTIGMEVTGFDGPQILMKGPLTPEDAAAIGWSQDVIDAAYKTENLAALSAMQASLTKAKSDLKAANDTIAKQKAALDAANATIGRLQTKTTSNSGGDVLVVPLTSQV